jgi:tetratricopeptide (TPR) repeat protein
MRRNSETPNSFEARSILRWRHASLLALVLLQFAPLHAIAQKTMPEASGLLDPAAKDIKNGMQMFRNRDFAAAAIKFNAAVRANPKSADAFTWRAITENQMKQYAVAERDFQTALSINPDELSAHYNLALTFIRLGNTDAAIEQLRTVFKEQPGVFEPEYNLAILLEGKKETAEAVEHLQAAYQARPNDAGVVQHLLVDLLILGRTGETQPLFEQLRSGPPSVQEKAGTALLEAEQFHPAVTLLANARAANEGREIDHLLARAYLGAGQYDQAIELLKPTESDDIAGEAAYLLGLAYSEKNDLPKAKEEFKRAISKSPRDGAAQYHLGLIESTNPAEPVEALHHLREALRDEPDNAVYGLMLGQILLQQDQAAQAAATLQKIQAKGPEAAERDLLLGIAYISTGRSKEATPILERAVKENSSLALSFNILGFCYFQQGDYARAADAHKQASDLRPEMLIFAHDAAIAFDRSSNADQAMVYAERAVEMPTASSDDHYLVGKLLARAGHKEDAVRELKEAVALSPDLDKPYYLLARTYMQMGDTAQATAWNAKLTDLKQKHERAYAAGKNVKPPASSTLLHGATITSAESEGP